jgi:hypothetical protein
MLKCDICKQETEKRFEIDGFWRCPKCYARPETNPFTYIPPIWAPRKRVKSQRKLVEELEAKISSLESDKVALMDQIRMHQSGLANQARKVSDLEQAALEALSSELEKTRQERAEYHSDAVKARATLALEEEKTRRLEERLKPMRKENRAVFIRSILLCILLLPVMAKIAWLLTVGM